VQVSKKFDFKNSSGETLSGRLELPAGKPKAFALFAHCFTCSKNFVAASKISKHLSLLGIATLRFDFTGLGNSEGDFSNTNFSSNIDDLKSAYSAIQKEYTAPALLIGHSLGGAAVLKLQEELDDVKAVVTVGAPSDVSHVAHLFETNIEEINKEGKARVNLAGREFEIQKHFIDDINEHDLLASLSESKKSFLILHSPTDATVSVDHAAKIYGALKHPKSYISLDKMDHLVTKAGDAQYIAELISSWVTRYLDIDEVEASTVKEGVFVESRSGFKFTNDITSAKHQLVADEPKSFKGNDLGMAPYELLLSSLGACTSMTMRMYADRKGFDLQNVKVSLAHEKVDTGGDIKQDVIHKHIELIGNLSDVEKEKILAIADKCPVNKTLLAEVKITKYSI
jgi:putative redox protein